MKLYYALADIDPDPENHYMNEDLTPDMTRPLYVAGQVICDNDVKYFKSNRKDLRLGVFFYAGIYTDEYRAFIKYVPCGNGCVKKIYTGVNQ